MPDMSKKIIYLDHAATTPVDEVVFQKMKPFFSRQYGNPSGLYALASEAEKALSKARQHVAQFLGCQPAEIYFTSGATESNNLAILGLVKRFRQENPQTKPHLITTSIEHPSVLKVMSALKKEGLAEVTFLKVSEEGIIDAKDVKKYLRPNTILVSVMYANNEIGSIQPVKEIGKIISSNKKESGYPFFHIDAAQAANYLDCSVKKLNCDLLTLSGHKIYGPKGIGALYLKEGTALSPLVYGGGQEQNIRPGTENLAAIVGLAAAVVKLKSPKAKNKQIAKLRDRLIDKTLKLIDEVKVNGNPQKSLPHIANLSFRRVEGESLVFELSDKGIAVSTGSACASKSLKPSPVLTAIGLSPIAAHSSVRFSLGRTTSKAEIDYLLKVLPKVVQRLRTIAGTN